MAQETKVGLLAGLAFIICFAIILANRGQRNGIPNQPPNVSYTPSVASYPSHTPIGTAPGTSSAAQRYVFSTRQDTGDVGVAPTLTEGSIPQRQERRRERAGDDLERTHGGNDRDETAVREIGRRSPNRSEAHPPVERVPGRVLTSVTVPSDVDGRVRKLERMLEQLDRKIARGNTTVSARQTGDESHTKDHLTLPAKPTRKPRVILARHRVVSGDTLSKLAGQYYGKTSRRGIDAIFQANQTVLSEPDNVRVGVELVIPEFATQKHRPELTTRSAIRSPAGSSTKAGSFTKTESSTKVKRRSPALSAGSTVRWYQIKKNDRYVSIAREQLGDASRWREIFEINRDTFPDAGLIREGVRIKLPPDDKKIRRERRR